MKHDRIGSGCHSVAAKAETKCMSCSARTPTTGADQLQPSQGGDHVSVWGGAAAAAAICVRSGDALESRRPRVDCCGVVWCLVFVVAVAVGRAVHVIPARRYHTQHTAIAIVEVSSPDPWASLDVELNWAIDYKHSDSIIMPCVARWEPSAGRMPQARGTKASWARAKAMMRMTLEE